MENVVEINESEMNAVSGGALLDRDTGKYILYTVQRGDCLTAIGTKFQVVWTLLYNINRGVIGSNPNLLQIGTVLKIPVK